MFSRAKNVIEACNKKNVGLNEIVLEEELKSSRKTADEIRAQLKEYVQVMEDSATENLDEVTETKYGMIDGFAKQMYQYSKGENTITGEFITESMAMAFSTLEVSADMGKIIASPTAGSAGILPATLTALKRKEGFSDDELVESILAAIAIGKVIGRHGSFAGAEGGCQAETGSASAMGAAAAVFLYGGSPEQSFHAASFAFIHVLGLVCDPIAGLVEYPCTFRNASGVVNAFISADMALAGIESIVPFDEVAIAVAEVGSGLPASLRETGIGGLAGSDTGRKIREDFLGTGTCE